jgi:hypothetical protein
MRDEFAGFGTAVSEASEAPRRWARTVLYALPLFTILVVAFALFVVGTPRPVTAARIWSGPTEGVTRLALRVGVIERYHGIESPAALDSISLEARSSDGRTRRWSGPLDERGMANPVLELDAPLRGALSVRVTGAGKALGEGELQLGAEEWRKTLRDLGGWVAHGSRSGTLLIQVAPARGALAVPFEEPLIVEVRSPSGPVKNAKLTFDPDGLALAPKEAMTDAYGRALIRVTPREHVVSLRVNAVLEGAKGSWFARLPIIPGALSARRTNDSLEIVSPIPRDVAYWSLIAHDRAIGRGSVILTSTPDGYAKASVPLPPGMVAESWAIVSGEPELDSSSTVGWPLAPPVAGAEPQRARVVVDPLLIDGTFRAEALDGQRRSRARWLAGGVTLVAILLASILLSLESRRSRTVLEAHLEESLLEEGAGERIGDKNGRWWTLLVALLCVALGFLVVALVALHRIE